MKFTILGVIEIVPASRVVPDVPTTEHDVDQDTISQLVKSTFFAI